MPISCRPKLEHGKHFCLTQCPASAPGGVFRYARVERPEDLPDRDERAVDVAVLDMNHGWPNLGHDSVVHAVLDAACDLIPELTGTGLYVRAISFEVRRRGMLPEGPGGRFGLYLGTGGPGHIDPRLNDGVSEGSQGLREDPAWEAPFFRLLDAIRENDEAALLAVCHTFGVLCRWSGTARPVLRARDKGGKSAGVLENLLTPEAVAHPWFRHFAEELPAPRSGSDREQGRRLRIVDHRLFDLLPEPGGSGGGPVPIGYETRGLGGPQGDAVTMLEFARDREGVMPRVFGVNHHPEIVDRARQMLILRQKLERGEVSQEWCDERVRLLTETYPEEDSDARLHLTSDYTLLGPLRYFVFRQVRLRAEALGLPVPLHEDRVFEQVAAGAHQPLVGGLR